MKEKYIKEVAPKLMREFGHKSIMAVPKLEKVVLNIGFGRQAAGKGPGEREKIEKNALDIMSTIAGQKFILTAAHSSIAAFKIRKGLIIGAKTTLRGQKMYDFLERLVNIALPRSRDFQGLDEKAVDQNGNLSIGIKEHIIFPEAIAERAQEIISFELTINTTAKTKKEAIALFKNLGFPLKS